LAFKPRTKFDGFWPTLCLDFYLLKFFVAHPVHRKFQYVMLLCVKLSSL